MSFFADPATDAVLDTFGEELVWRRPGHPDEPLTGIFDSRWLEVFVEGAAAPVSEKSTTAAIRLSDAPAMARLHTIIARGTEYRVQDLRPDGQDMAILLLELIGDGT